MSNLIQPTYFKRLARRGLIGSVALLSACTSVGGNGDMAAATKNSALYHVMADTRGLSAKQLQPIIYSYDGNLALKHLFRVACGLDSLVLGEPQVLGQLKDAVRLSRKNGCCSNLLGRAFDAAFTTAKRVRSDTEIGVGGVSVAYVAVTLASQIFSTLDSATALLVGAGDTIELVAQHLRDRGVHRFIVANRTLERGQSLANSIATASCHAEARPFADLVDLLPQADVIVTSTAAREPLIHKADVKRALKARRHRSILLIDLAVPRDVAADVNKLDAAYVYTVDDLQRVIQENTESREAAVVAAENIVNDGIDEFVQWQQSLAGVELIKHLRMQSDTLMTDALAKASKSLAAGDAPEQVVRALANSLTNKLLHAPSAAIRDAAAENDQATLWAAAKLFDLDASPLANDDNHSDNEAK